MKTITFDYAKKDGSKSERTLLALTQPTDKYSGIDVSELSPVQAEEFIKLYTQLHDAFIMRAKALQADFDLTHSFRQFLPSGMSNVTEI